MQINHSRPLLLCSMRPPTHLRAGAWGVAAAAVLTMGIAGGELRAQTPLAWTFQKGDVLRYKIHYKSKSVPETSGEPTMGPGWPGLKRSVPRSNSKRQGRLHPGHAAL